MGCIYRQKKKLEDGTLIETGPYWLKYYRDGRPICESAETEVYADAKTKLQQKEGDVAHGLPVSQKTARVLVNELLEDLKDEYQTNGRKTLADLEGRCKNHLEPFFGKLRAANVTTSHIRQFIVKRQKAKASNAEINRELAALKRAFSLAVKSTPPKLLHKPFIPMLAENNIRQGFFERQQFEAVLRHLPGEYHDLLKFAYITGWRCLSEIQTRQWKHVDWRGSAVRLEPGETKNREGRLFPFKVMPELRELLERQREKHKELKQRGVISPSVFCREDGAPIKDYRKSWKNACIAAGIPGRIVHDFRRTAIRNLERAGVSRSVAMKLTGHKTESVYRRYAIVSESDLSEGVAKLAALKATVTETVTVEPLANELATA